MAYIVGMVSQKGGVGKSTLARLFARELAKDGFAVRIADLDTQQATCTEWAAARAGAEITPEIHVTPFDSLEAALGEAEAFDICILDGRPHSSQQTLEVAQAADLAVIPAGQTKDDLRPAVTLAHSLADAGIAPERIAFALVKVTGSAAEQAAARAYLGQTEYTTLDGFLPVSTAYGIAHDKGRAATETPFRTLNEKAGRLAQSVIDRLAALAADKETG